MHFYVVKISDTHYIGKPVLSTPADDVIGGLFHWMVPSFTKDLDKARRYKRASDATQSINYWMENSIMLSEDKLFRLTGVENALITTVRIQVHSFTAVPVACIQAGSK